MARLRTGDIAEVHQWTVEVPSAINLPVDELAHAFCGDGRNLLNFMSLLPDLTSIPIHLAGAATPG